MMHKIAKTENIFHFVCDHREIQSLQDEIAELRERLKIAEADLAKAITGEKKASDEVSGHVIIMWIMKMTVISIGNRMNLLVHFMIYGHERCFESSQSCTSRRRVQFENFQNITSDHKSRNARAGSYDFLFIIFSTKQTGCQPFFYNLVFKFGASPVFPWQLLHIALYNLYCTL